MKYWALVLLAACDPYASDVVCDDKHFVAPQTSVVATDSAFASFMQQLRKGSGEIVLTSNVDCGPQPIDLAPYISQTTHSLTIKGTGGFTGRAVLMCHLRLSHLRDFELVMEDVTIYRGSFKAEYLQQSVLNRVRIQESEFRVEFATGLVTRDSHLYDADVFIGGANAILFDNTLLIDGSLEIRGDSTPNSYSGFVNLSNMHVEHSTVLIQNVKGSLLFLTGYFFNSRVDVWNSSRPKVIEGDWVLSDLWIDNKPQKQGCR